ncbi:MAG: GTPase domain-containing protein [Rhodococcus sp. (in: high G+C Gram-positive bacteria)]|uniref:GTPase domain-containing protein n=1 Tax=Rhodococcus sp. TaxID=1831 RepID=UPI003BB62B0C
MAKQYADRWAAFATPDHPVVTLFGSYDTGKSSLLRRVLVDSGSQVPDWLTISARHETFEVNEVETAGYTIRDTPGFVVGAADARGQNNSQRAMAAVGLTDIGIAVLTPQLATAERDLLQKVVAEGWPPGSLWFVISRFDEAGVDPEYDLDEYRELSARKVKELREVFDLSAEVPVFVVAQDPFQTAGPATDIDRGEWDAYRDWDGMRDLTASLDAISLAQVTALREAAGRRHWGGVLADVLDELRGQLVEYRSSAEVAATGVARRDGWKDELDALDRAARASLDGLLMEVVRQADSGLDTGYLQGAIPRQAEQWFTKYEGRLERLKQSIGKAANRERARPSWESFASLIVSVGAESDASVSEPREQIAPHVEQIGQMLIGVLKAADGQRSQQAKALTAKAASGAKAAGGLNRHIGIAEAALPLAVHIAKWVDDSSADRATQGSGRSAQTRGPRQLVDTCTAHVTAIWQPFVDDVRDVIDGETADQVALYGGLCRLVEQLQDSIAEGESLNPIGTVPVREQ